MSHRNLFRSPRSGPHPGRGLGTQVSTTIQEVQRPLLTPDECQRMPGPQKDEYDRITAAGDMVIYCAGFPAIYGRQPLYFEDETFAARAAIPTAKAQSFTFWGYTRHAAI
jgi:type IV secretion system protein VirD4